MTTLDLTHPDPNERERALRARRADLFARLAALEARPGARHPAQQENIEDFRERLAEADRALLGYQLREGFIIPGINGILFFLPRRDVPNPQFDQNPRFPDGSSFFDRFVKAPSIAVRREGTGVRRERGRARPYQEHALLVGAAPVLVASRREAIKQARLAVLYGAGDFPPVLVLRGRTRSRWLFEHRKGGRSNRTKRKAEVLRRAKIRGLLAIAEIVAALGSKPVFSKRLR